VAHGLLGLSFDGGMGKGIEWATKKAAKKALLRE